MSLNERKVGLLVDEGLAQYATPSGVLYEDAIPQPTPTVNTGWESTGVDINSRLGYAAWNGTELAGVETATFNGTELAWFDFEGDGSTDILTSISCPNLTNTNINSDDYIYISDFPNLTTINLSSLNYCGNINILNCDALLGLTLPSLAGGVTLLRIVSCATIVSFSIPNVDTLFRLQVSACDLFTTLESPLLTTLTNLLLISDCTALTELDFSLIETCPTIQIYGNTSLASILFDSITTISSYIQLKNSVITTLAFPLLTTCPSIDLTDNSLLTTFDINTLTIAPTVISATGCALNVASVNAILVKCDALTMTSGTIDLSGGTSAAPTGAGATAAANLVLAGVTVTTN